MKTIFILSKWSKNILLKKHFRPSKSTLKPINHLWQESQSFTEILEQIYSLAIVS